MQKGELTKVTWIFLLLVAIFFHRVFLGELPGPFNWLYYWLPWNRPGLERGGNFIISDQMDQFMPMLAYMRSSIFSGHFPLWNSQLIFGIPFLLLPICGHWFPLTVLSLIPPLEFYWLIQACLKFLLIGLSTYALLRLYKCRPVSAMFGAISLAFSLYSVVWLGDFLSTSFAALPGLFYAITRFSQTGATRLSSLFLFLCSVNLLLSSFPSVAFYGCIAAVIYSVLVLGPRLFSRDGAYFIGIGVLALLTCALPLWATAQYLSLIDLGFRDHWATHHLLARHFGLLIFPELFGNYSTMSINRMGNYNEVTGYFGIAAVILAILHAFLTVSVKAYRTKIGVFWLAVQLWSVGMIYGLFGVLDFFGQLPVFRSNPSTRIFALLVLSSIVIASLALEGLSSTKIRRDQKFKTLALALIALLGLVCWVWEELPVNLVDFGNVFEITLIAGFSSVVLVALAHGARWAAPLLCLTTFLHLFLLGYDYNGFYKAKDFYPVTSSIEFLQKNLEPGEKIAIIGKQFIPQTPLFYGIGAADSRWFLTEKQIEMLQELDPGYRAVHKTSSALRTLDFKRSYAVLNFLNVKYILVDRAHFKEYPLDPNLYRIAEHFNDRVTLIENLSRPYHTTSANSDCDDQSIYNFYYHDNTVRFSANSCNARKVRLPIWDYPGWSLTDKSSEEVQFIPEQGFLAVNLPAGKSAATLRFRPRQVIPLILLGLLALGCAAGLVYRAEHSA